MKAKSLAMGALALVCLFSNLAQANVPKGMIIINGVMAMNLVIDNADLTPGPKLGAALANTKLVMGLNQKEWNALKPGTETPVKEVLTTAAEYAKSVVLDKNAGPVDQWDAVKVLAALVATCPALKEYVPLAKDVEGEQLQAQLEKLNANLPKLEAYLAKYEQGLK